MSISDIINGTGAASGAAQGSGIKKKDQLGQAEFLELMIAQLKNQDPFKAMDPSQFLGQLAQFGTVSGIQEMQAAFGTLSDAMRSSQVSRPPSPAWKCRRRSARCRTQCVPRKCSTARP
jgi:flagellar basal-body rod modification protein FlgD